MTRNKKATTARKRNRRIERALFNIMQEHYGISPQHIDRDDVRRIVRAFKGRR